MITGAVAAQAYQLHRHLDNADEVFFADSADVPMLSKNSKFLKIPFGDSSAFAHSLLSICLDHGIQKVYPLRKSELLPLAEARTLFDEYGIQLIVPEKDLISSLLNKGVKGQIIIREGSDEMPDRGIFVVDPQGTELQLFTAD